MGTNYYMVKGEHYAEGGYDHPLNPLLKWGTGRPPMIHIGKSSGGWCFSLRVYPDNGVHTLTDWRHFAIRLVGEGWRIEDEYRTEHTLDDLWRVVERESWKELASKYPLRRHIVDETHCIGNGEGLYDYMVGEFS
jgi:hypothetical protein